MKSIAIVMHVTAAVAAELTNDRADVARRGAALARLWRWGDRDDWRPASDPRKTWGGLLPVAVVIMVYNPDAEALLAADVDELRPLLRHLSPLTWRFIKVADPVGRPAVGLQGVTVDEVRASDESYDHRAALALLWDAPVMTTAN